MLAPVLVGQLALAKLASIEASQGKELGGVRNDPD
jgi:hypothetical protein